MSYPSRKCDHCQSKISSSCYICDWCESRKMGGRGSPKLPTPMVESFSADLPAIKCYWTESRLRYKIVVYNATSVGVGRRNDFFMYV